jgi:hypothetical protein
MPSASTCALDPVDEIVLQEDGVNSPWSEKSVSVVKKVADLIDLSPRFFISASVIDSVVPAMQ